MRWLKIAEGKSGSREVAAALLIFWTFITGWLLWWIERSAVDSYKDIYSTITTAVFTFGLGAFGVQAVMNRIGPSAPPRRDGPTPDMGPP